MPSTDQIYGASQNLNPKRGVLPNELGRLNVGWVDISQDRSFKPVKYRSEELPGFQYLWVAKGLADNSRTAIPRIILGIEVETKTTDDAAVQVMKKVLTLHGIKADLFSTQTLKSMINQGHPSLSASFTDSNPKLIYDPELGEDRSSRPGDITARLADDPEVPGKPGETAVSEYGQARMGGELYFKGGEWYINNSSGRTSTHLQFSYVDWHMKLLAVAELFRRFINLRVKIENVAPQTPPFIKSNL